MEVVDLTFGTANKQNRNLLKGFLDGIGYPQMLVVTSAEVLILAMMSHCCPHFKLC